MRGEEPIAHDSDCREGICGTCSLTINGVPHGNCKAGIATCQLHMRTFQDGETIYVEPFRAKAFPIVRDLIVDRSAFDRVIQAGGYVSVRTGSAPDANALPVPKFNRRPRHGRRGVHRLRRVRGGVPERQRDVVRGREDVAASPCCRRVRPNAASARWRWCARWTRKASAIVPTCTTARPCARRKSARRSSRG